MVGSVTVTGPPCEICFRKVGITLPRLPTTLPNRTAEKTHHDSVNAPHDLFGEPFRRTHHTGRAHRLVGRDEDEPSDTTRHRRVHDVRRPEDVREDGFLRVRLEDRHVFVSGGVEHDLRTMFQEQGMEALSFPDVCQDRGDPRHVRQLGQEFVQMCLVVIDDGDRDRIESERLPNDLGSDRAAGAGHEHAFALEQVTDRLCIGLDLLAPQQVLDAEVTDVSRRDATSDDLVDRGQDAQLDFSLFTQGRDISHQVARRRGHSHQHLLHLHRPDDGGEHRARAEDGHTAQ